jgi:hypothetical protein
MKKIKCTILILTGLFVHSFTSQAQDRIQIGVQYSPQFTSLVNFDDRSNPYFEYLNTTHSSFGASLQYQYTSELALGIDLTYSIQGQRYKYIGIEGDKRVDYVKIPFLLVYSSELPTDILFIAKGGLQLGILTRAKLTDKDGGDIVSDQSNAYAKYDYSVFMAAGLGYKLDERIFMDFELKFDYSFTNAENPNANSDINFPFPGSYHRGLAAADRASTFNNTAGLIVELKYLLK